MSRHLRLALALGVALVLGTSARGAAQDRRWPSERPPRPLAARNVAFPPFEIRTLSNGLQVVVVNHNEQPVVSLRLIVRAGTAQHPAARPGAAALAVLLLDQGTATRSAKQIAETIDSVGGDLTTGVGRDLCYVDVVVMKDSFALAAGLLADIARNPAFAPDEIERQRQQVLSALRVRHDDPEYVANVVFDRLVYGFHPYGLPGNGTRDSVALITRDDLRAFHSQYFAPNNTLLAVVGDVTTAEVMTIVTGAFGDWPRRALP